MNLPLNISFTSEHFKFQVQMQASVHLWPRIGHKLRRVKTKPLPHDSRDTVTELAQGWKDVARLEAAPDLCVLLRLFHSSHKRQS